MNNENESQTSLQVIGLYFTNSTSKSTLIPKPVEKTIAESLSTITSSSSDSADSNKSVSNTTTSLSQPQINADTRQQASQGTTIVSSTSHNSTTTRPGYPNPYFQSVAMPQSFYSPPYPYYQNSSRFSPSLV